MKVATILGWAALAAAFVSAPASAAVINYTTTGCFGSGCTNYSSIAKDPGTGQLTFYGAADINPFNVNLPATVSLGTFVVDSSGQSFNGGSFVLDVKFTSPGNSSTVYDASLKGSYTDVFFGGKDTISLTFAGPQTFDNGQYELTINSPLTFTADFLDIGATASASLTGVVTAVPEASTWAMLLLGFVGVGFVSYRRSQRQPSFRLV
jgi:hypothetical protein